VDVATPAGIDDAAVLRLRGQGDAGAAGGPAGDALVTVAVRCRPGLSRKGVDLHSPLPLNLWDALLGGEVTVTTVRGVAVQLVVPPGTAHGVVLSLPREGVDARGSHHFEVKIATPTALTVAEEALVRRLAAMHAAGAH
jgi:DnaJ-class molecular chaperone